MELRCGERARALDVQHRAVTLASGEVLHYDRLLVATGATPVIPPIPGIGAKGVYPFLDPCRRGGDPDLPPGGRSRHHGRRVHRDKTGLPPAGAGIRVAVFEKEPRLASRIFDQRASDIVREHLRGHGLTVETGTGIAEIASSDGWVSGVRLEDGRTFGAQILVAAVGCAAEHRASRRRTRGSARDDPGRDPGERTDGDRPPPHLRCRRRGGDAGFAHRSALQQRRLACRDEAGCGGGANMAGGRRTYVHNFSLNAMNLYGLQLASAGHPYEQEGGEIRVFQEERVNNYRKVIVKAGALIGFILIGDTSRAGHLISRMKRRDRIADPADLFARDRHALSGLPPNGGFRHGALWL